MKLQNLTLKNFRCFSSESIEFSEYTPLLGPNNCGKSTVLRALDIFFLTSSKSTGILKEDFYVLKITEPLEISLTFSSLSKEETDDFNHYARAGILKFILRASLGEDGQVSSRVIGVRLGQKALAPFFEATNAAEKKKVYEVLKGQGVKLDNWKNEELATKAIQEIDASDTSKWEELESGAHAYGAIGPLPKIKKYLDWIYIPAVKEASDEASEGRKSAFTRLVLKAIKNKVDFSKKFAELTEAFNAEIKKELESEIEPLRALEKELDKEFKLLTSTNIDVALDWDSRSEVVGLTDPLVRTFFKDGPVRAGPEYFGHGIQRTYIMALLPLVAKHSKEHEGGQRLLLGIEEPELYQHPPQARFLSAALSKLSEADTQIVISTHSPYFVDARRFDQIRLIEKITATSKVKSWTIDEQRNYYSKVSGKKEIGPEAAKSSLDRLLQPAVSEMFFCKKAIFVEGIEDVAIITAYLKHRKEWDEFLKHGCHFITSNGKPGLPPLITLARGFAISHFFVFDFDMDHKVNERQNENLGKFIAEMGVQLPAELGDDLIQEKFVSWENNIQKSIARTSPDWKDVCIKIAADWGWNIDRMDKDPMLLEAALQTILENNEFIPALDKLVDKLKLFWQS